MIYVTPVFSLLRRMGLVFCHSLLPRRYHNIQGIHFHLSTVVMHDFSLFFSNKKRTFLPKINSPVVFAHNDLQEGNILIRPEFESVEDKLALIDFEYCSYNYRGFDLANHFCEWSYNYNVEVYPNFAFTPKDLPSQEEMVRSHADNSNNDDALIFCFKCFISLAHILLPGVFFSCGIVAIHSPVHPRTSGGVPNELYRL